MRRSLWGRVDDAMANLAWLALVLAHVGLAVMFWVLLARGG